MSDKGKTAAEIQPQSRHKDLATLMKYIQMNPSRIRSAYDDVFEQNTHEKRQPNPPTHDNNEDYRKVIIKKYLSNEINLETMNSLLKTFEDKQPKPERDIAYW